MKKIGYLFFTLSIIPLISFSQDLSQNVISVQGGISQFDNISLEWTLGEAFAVTAINTDVIYSQGFNQPFLTTTKLENENFEKSLFNIVLYPNPVDEILHVYIETDQRTKLHLSLYDFTGKLIQNDTILETDKDVTLDLNNYPKGVYLLKFIDTKGAIIETHRIVKK